MVDHRSSLLTGSDVIDVEQASAGSFSSDAAQIFPVWASFVSWAVENTPSAARRTLPPDAEFGAPSPRPSQVFVIGANYADHASEAQMDLPEVPMVITKFPSCITGTSAPLAVAHPCTDWEAELVVIIGSACVNVPEADAWAQVAGLTIGQDISDRELQFTGQPAQFSLGKSRRGYGPTGPWLVTADECADPSDLAISCTLNGQRVQQSRTSRLIHPLPKLIAYLSAIVELRPGDLIFTGTPAGVGFSRTPPVYLKGGDELITTIEGIGSMRTLVVAADGEETSTS